MRKTKLLSLFLALACVLSSLAVLTACNPGEDEEDTDFKRIEREGWFDECDFKGETLTIDQSINLWDPIYSIDNAAKFTQGPDKRGTDKVENLCYERNLAVKEKLNLNLRFISRDWMYNEIAPGYQTLSMSDDMPDIIINDVYPVVSMALKGQLVNVKTEDAKYGKNYFDFYAVMGADPEKNREGSEVWYNDYMSGLTIDEDKIYGLAGDYFMDVIRSAHCLYMNTDIFKEISNGDNFPYFGYTEEDSLRAFYSHIESGVGTNAGFTYSDLIDLVRLAYVPSGTDAVEKIEDRLGYLAAGGVAFSPYIFSIGLDIYNDGQIATEATTLSQVVDGLLTLFVDQKGALQLTGGQVNSRTTREKFTSGGTLFVSNYWLGDLEYSSFKAMENKAAIVYPKLNTTYSDYGTYVHDSAEIGYISAHKTRDKMKRFSASSAFLQLACEESNNIVNVYFNDSLKFKNNTDPFAVSQLDIIRNSIASPFDQLILTNEMSKNVGASGYSIGGIVQQCIEEERKNNTSTFYTSSRGAYVAGCNTFVYKYNQLS